MACTHPSIHFSLDEDTLEITVGCPLCAYPSIHVEDTLKITVGCLVCGVVCVLCFVFCVGVGVGVWSWWCCVGVVCCVCVCVSLCVCEQGGKQSINQKCF